MRKLMWFVIGFAIAAAVGSYALALKWYLLAAGISAVLLGVSLACMLRFPKVRIAGMVCFGCIIGFCFQAGFDWMYLSTARAADEMTLDVSIYATDYSYETDYGCAVMGRVELSGKQYKVQTYLPEKTHLAPGDWVNGSFMVKSTLPGCSKESQYSRGDGVFLKAYPESELQLFSPEKMPISAYPAYICNYLGGMIDYIFPADTAPFAKALLLGNTDDLSYETDTDLKISGIRHVIAVSGLHVTILFSLVYALTGRKKWLTAIVGLPVLFAFAAVSGFSPSITRACIMHALTVIALLFDREYDPPTALSFAVLAMLLCNPWTLTNVGFQLSVGCMAGIFLFSEPMKNWLMDRARLGRFNGWIKKLLGPAASGVAITISAGMITTPLSACYFGVVSMVSMLTNLLTLWIISFIFYGIMLACVVALLHVKVAGAIACAISWPIRYVLKMAQWMADLPLSAVYTQSQYILMWLVLCYVLLTVYLLMKKKQPILLGCCATFTLCVALFASWMEPLTDECRVTVLDVGQGQCILLQSEGRNFLVDCGGSDDETAADEAAALLLSQGVSKLDGLIITHYDRDHAGGAEYLLTRVGASCLYLPNCVDDDGTADALYNYTGGAVYTVENDVTITFGGTCITLVPSESNLNNNESGLCVLYQTENCDILITGDRSAQGERELIEHMELPELEVLIVGHHGSKYSTCRELLIKTSPQYAIISVGAENHYGHPTDEVLQRLKDFGCIVYRTDQNGTIIYRG